MFKKIVCTAALGAAMAAGTIGAIGITAATAGAETPPWVHEYLNSDPLTTGPNCAFVYVAREGQSPLVNLNTCTPPTP